jgi:hypothetical protein
MNTRFGFETYYGLMTEKEIENEILEYSFTDNESTALLYAPEVENALELARMVNFMKEELKLLVLKVETFTDANETTYYIKYKGRPSYLVRIK